MKFVDGTSKNHFGEHYELKANVFSNYLFYDISNNKWNIPNVFLVHIPVCVCSNSLYVCKPYHKDRNNICLLVFFLEIKKYEQG